MNVLRWRNLTDLKGGRNLMYVLYGESIFLLGDDNYQVLERKDTRGEW